jgi:hypothetical protein
MTAAALLAALGPVLADGEKTGAVRAKPRLAAPAAPPLPFLVHNGSLMSQVFDPTSGHLLIQYKDPRPGLSPVGVIPGTVLFDGQIPRPGHRRHRVRLQRLLPTTPYRVIGEVLPDGALVLRGPAPLLDPYSCNVITLIASHNSELVFVPYGEPR